MSHADSFSPVVIVPTYNNCATVVDVLREIASLNLPLIVVNDGCTDDTVARLAQWVEQAPAACRIVSHDVNRGKAAALMSGFTEAIGAGFTHAVTIDSDGQLSPGDIPGLIEKAQAHPDALILGTRSLATENYPLASRIGRAVSNTAIFMECGRRVRDSQCGLRVYPLRLIAEGQFHAGRFAFEAEVITRAVWAGCPLVEAPVRCVYRRRGEHISHFRPWADSLHGVALHLRLLGRAMLPIPRRRFMIRSDHEAHPRVGPLRRFWGWINPMRAWRQVFDVRISRGELGSALAAGVFVANMPVYPFQTCLALYVAQRLHLHPALVIAGSTVSTPPLGFVLVAAAIGVGHFVLTGEWPDLADFDLRNVGPTTLAGSMLASWIIGSFIVGLGTAVVAFFAAISMVEWARHRRGRETGKKPG